MSEREFWGSQSPKEGKETEDKRRVRGGGREATSGVTATKRGKQKTPIGAGNETEGLQETNVNRQKGQNGDQETERRTGGVVDRRETSMVLAGKSERRRTD
jgi:hypothetical protein